MSKTIILGINSNFLPSTSKWAFYLIGLTYSISGTINLMQNSIDTTETIFGSTMMIGGVLVIIYGYMQFSESSKYAPRVRVDENEIELKNSFTKPVKRIKWIEVKKIEFDAYQLIFQLSGGPLVFSYVSNPDVSIEIKKLIRETAEEKNIEVVGG